MVRTSIVLALLAATLAAPAVAAPPSTTLGTAATIDYRLVLTARRTSTGSAPSAAVTAATYRRRGGVWVRTRVHAVPGTYFWYVVSGRNAVCELSLSTAGGARPHATVRLLLSPSLGCPRAYTFALA